MCYIPAYIILSSQTPEIYTYLTEWEKKFDKTELRAVICVLSAAWLFKLRVETNIGISYVK
jgi:hypothetical protein